MIDPRIHRPRHTLVRLWHAARTDGCTSAPDLIFFECCARHDRDYTTHSDAFGRPLTRAQADRRLFDCMRKRARGAGIRYYFVPFVFYAAVRAFGASRW